MAPEQPNHGGEHSSYESIEQWNSICSYCFRTISSARPPVFNPDNCGCAETGTFVYGNHEPSLSSPYEVGTYQYEAAVYGEPPPSSTSSAEPVPCPEGPERAEPDLPIENTFLPLGPEVGHNELQHRRSASFHSDISYQMRQFLSEGSSYSPVKLTETPARFISQDVHIQCQSVKNKKKQKPSWHSEGSRSEDEIFFSGEIDPTIAVGSQFDQSGYEYFENGYPMTMSGISGLSE